MPRRVVSTAEPVHEESLQERELREATERLYRMAHDGKAPPPRPRGRVDPRRIPLTPAQADASLESLIPKKVRKKEAKKLAKWLAKANAERAAQSEANRVAVAEAQAAKTATTKSARQPRETPVPTTENSPKRRPRRTEYIQTDDF